MAQRLLAVYGTLKQPYGNHRLIERAKLNFEGNAYSKDDSFVMEGGGFPFVHVTEPGNDKIRVELYSFESDEDIRDIDRLEGHPDWYIRTPFKFVVDNPVIGGDLHPDQVVTAEMYVQQGKKFSFPNSNHPTVYRSESVAEWGYHA